MSPQQNQIQVNINEDIKKGRYANFLQLNQTTSEATLDFIFTHPQTGGDIVSRVIVTPDFLQQIAQLLSNQSAQGVSVADESKKAEIGFRADNKNG